MMMIVSRCFSIYNNKTECSVHNERGNTRYLHVKTTKTNENTLYNCECPFLFSLHLITFIWWTLLDENHTTYGSHALQIWWKMMMMNKNNSVYFVLNLSVFSCYPHCYTTIITSTWINYTDTPQSKMFIFIAWRKITFYAYPLSLFWIKVYTFIVIKFVSEDGICSEELFKFFIIIIFRKKQI